MLDERSRRHQSGTMFGPRRIVCLTEETTELLYLLGEEQRIVGISAYTVRPPEARKRHPVVSAFGSGSVERIRRLKPDLVVGFSDIQADLAASLIRAGLPVLVTNQRSLEEILESMQMLAGIVGRAERGAELIGRWRQAMEATRRSTEDQLRPAVFFQEWDEPLISAIRWVSELIELVGGRDIFAELREAGLARDRTIEPAEAGRRNPDLIVGSWCGKAMDHDWVRNHPDWQQVPAIRNNQIYEMDPSIILQPGPALFLEGMQTLQSLVDRARRAMTQ